jgi:hypothetical protein
VTELDDGVIGYAVFRVDHGLIILEDPGSEYDHADWDPATQFVSAGPDSLYLSVRPSVDGPVEVVLATEEVASERARHVYFDGDLNLHSRYAVLHDADDVVRFTVRYRQGRRRVRVMVDEPGFVSYMVVSFLDPGQDV